MFDTILVANRGEIACRILRSARDLGYRTVAVYTRADAQAPHVSLADRALCIGDGAVGDSYLSAETLIKACKEASANAVHPGYGFLSENSAFAEACHEADITFIGPPANAIELMGSKAKAKQAMLAAAVPCIPGYQDEDQSDDRLLSAARDIGYPVMIKASAGGGGRGMRLATDDDSFLAQLESARSEARNAFGSDRLILEKAITNARHIEIQVFADQQGHCVYLGERDCSLQRRHQKVIEEAPSPFVDASLREAMGRAAVRAAQSCNYIGAGTVEFLVDEDRNFYFLEMNTRLQVEHPVTELVTGLDLVALQIKVAAGKPLPLAQEEVELEGHAMEVRLYAEDTAANFLPQTGTVLAWKPYQAEGIRVDDGITSGQVLSPFYDPMLAKLIAFGPDRETARRRLLRAVEDSLLFGVTSNQRFLQGLLKHDAFIQGEANTSLIGAAEDTLPGLTKAAPQPDVLVVAALAMSLMKARGFCGELSPMTVGTRFANSLSPGSFVSFRQDTQHWQAQIQQHSERQYAIEIQDDPRQAETIRVLGMEPLGDSLYRLRFVQQDRLESLLCHFEDAILWLHYRGETLSFQDQTEVPGETAQSATDGIVRAPMDGTVVAVPVECGTRVETGDALVVLEAMKMEHTLRAPISGSVANLSLAVGSQVRVRQVLVEVMGET